MERTTRQSLFVISNKSTDIPNFRKILWHVGLPDKMRSRHLLNSRVPTAVIFLFHGNHVASKYPDMEHHLAVHIRDLRSCGIIVQSWMANEEAKIPLHELYPIAFLNPPDPRGKDKETYGLKYRRVN